MRQWLMLVGSSEFIHKARKYRKALGGGMRQVGFLAAAGLEALKLIARLEEDHNNARYLAESLNELPGLSVDLEKLHKNIKKIYTTRTRKNSAELVYDDETS